MRSLKSLLMLGVMAIASASAWAFDTVTSLPKGQETKMSYVLSTPRGELYCNNAVSAANLLTTIKHSATASKTDKKFQFLLFQSKNESTGYYIYNVSLGKFLGTFSGNDVTMTDGPALWYIFKTGKNETNQDNQINSTRFNCADFPFCVSSSDATVGGSAIAVSSWDCSYGTRVSGADWDGGNQYCVAEAESVETSVWKTAYDKVVAYEASLGENQGGGLAGELDPTNVIDPDTRAKQEAAALDIINRFTDNGMNVKVILDLCRTTKGCDQYTYSATADELTVHASCAVAACRGFYDYVKAKGAGFCSWSGNRFEKPSDMACDEVNVICMFRDHEYFNVVTYGYTAPYWGKARWRQELDWMAFHGVDMPLMLVGSEAIYRDVFVKDFGLSDTDVNDWEVGPAHLPWFRMGNLAGNSFDGPLGNEWYENQRELAHYLLDEMDKLGMKPVCPAFGGFVPKAFSQKVSGAASEDTGWGWMPTNYRNYRLSPGSDYFVQVGKKFMERWEKEYGVGKYYLSDSFNEMTIPGSTTTLTQYGDHIYDIIKSSQNPESVWVTQGWTFCYQHKDWGDNETRFNALTKNVDPNRFVVLYMSPEYAELYGVAKNFDYMYKGFGDKGWNYTMLPNMGGKSFWTGNLNKYAKNYLNELSKATNLGNITGYGMTPEGVENNEMLYELITDAGWTNNGKTIELDDWFEQYGQSRYGSYSDEMKAFHQVLRSTLYGTYKDHPRFAWQVGGNLTGTAIGSSVNANFQSAIETLFSNTEALKAVNTPLLESELIEAVSMYVGAKIESLCQQIKNAKSDKAECQRLILALDELMMNFDAALELHPTWNLKRWEDMAQACGTQDAVRNAQNARRIVTIWFGNHTRDEEVQDYAARIWGGLVRDYYRPRLINKLKTECGLLSGWNRIQWESEFVMKAPYLSEARPVTGNHIDFLAKLVNEAKNFGSIVAEPVDEFIASTDTENHWYALHPAANKDNALTTAGDNAALSVAADMMEDSQVWRIVATGTDTYRLESRFGFNAAVVDGAAKSYLAPVNCDVKIVKADAAQKTWTITPVAGSADLFSGNWTITEFPASLVPEAASIDYGHYVRRLAGYTQTELFGQPTEPKSTAALRAGIAQLQTEAGNIDHKTYDTFLSQWNDVKTATLTASENADATRLAELIMGAHVIIVPADAQTSDAAANLFAAITAAETVAASENGCAEAYDVLTQAILAYYKAGGAITNTEVENLAPESTGWKMKITAVFPNGNEHAVFSNGQELTAATEVSANGIVEFDVVKMDGDLAAGTANFVLKAGDQYIHWTSGDDKAKSDDLDGLNEDYNPDLNVLTVKTATETGLQTTTYDKSPIASLYEVIGNGSNGSAFNFTLREKDNGWVSGDSGMKFFDNNWDGIGCRTSFFRVELIEPEGPVFPLNFDWEADATNARKIAYIALTAQDGEEQKFDVDPAKVYSDLTETAVFEVKEGQTVSGKIGYNGAWMNGYFYIDLDGDRNLTYNVDKIDQTGTEVFSYTYWTGDLSNDKGGKNSLGQTVNGNSVSGNVIALPAFTAPAAGEYKVRFKVDWNSVEPGGNTLQSIIGNGGYIVDAVLKVIDGAVGIDTVGALTDLIEKAKRGEATLEEVNAFAARILVFDLTGRRVRRLAPGNIYIVSGKRIVW